jgi:hypothetical protein
MGAVFVGGLVRRIAEARLKERFHAEAGILCASGLVAGEGLAGVFVAGRALAAGGVKAAVPPYGAFQIALSIALLVAAGWLVHRASRHPDAATAA